MQDEGGRTGGAMSCMENACMHGCASVCMYICVFLQDCVCYVCVCVSIREQATDWKEPGAVEMPRGQPREGIFYQSPHTPAFTNTHTHTLTHSKTYTQIMT